LLGTSRYRTSADKHSRAAGQQPLLTIPSERIVPTPLHLFLGISNRIILDAFSELLGKERVQSALATVTTVHSAGCSGKSDLFDLNGPEICKWIKQECSARVLAAAAATTSPAVLPAATTATHSILTRWLQQLHTHLLHKREWTATEIFVWRSVVSDIHQHWRVETSINAFPNCTCCTTRSTSLSGIASSGGHRRRRLSPSTLPSTPSSISSIATSPATLLSAFAAPLPMLRCAPCSPSSSPRLHTAAESVAKRSKTFAPLSVRAQHQKRILRRGGPPAQ
jgi:hypothetical protein